MDLIYIKDTSQKGSGVFATRKILKNEIENLDPNSEERQLINLSLRRYKSVGK